MLAPQLFQRLIELRPKLEHVNYFQRTDDPGSFLGRLFFLKVLIENLQLDIIKAGLPARKILTDRKSFL